MAGFLGQVVTDGSLWRDTYVTALETLLGFLVGNFVGTLIGLSLGATADLRGGQDSSPS